MPSGGRGGSTAGPSPRPAAGSSGIATSGSRTSSASTGCSRNCSAHPPGGRCGNGRRGGELDEDYEGERDMLMTIEKAQVTMPSDREVTVTRSFKAPRALVFRAYTEPALVRRWMLGPPGWSLPICEMDVRVGGSYRWRWRSDTDAAEFGFVGTFREVQPPSRLVHTERFVPGTAGDGDPSGGEALVTTTFAEAGGITTVTT